MKRDWNDNVSQPEKAYKKYFKIHCNRRILPEKLELSAQSAKINTDGVKNM